MLTFDYDEKFTDLIIQENWRNGFIPQFIGLVVGNGKLISINQNYNLDNFTETKLEVLDVSDIKSFPVSQKNFIEVTVMSKIINIPNSNCQAIFGEGQMGNEGFVAVTRDGLLIWSAFFTNSNPFYELNLVKNTLIAKSTHEIYWKFPMARPWDITLSL